MACATPHKGSQRSTHDGTNEEGEDDHTHVTRTERWSRYQRHDTDGPDSCTDQRRTSLALHSPAVDPKDASGQNPEAQVRRDVHQVLPRVARRGDCVQSSRYETDPRDQQGPLNTPADIRLKRGAKGAVTFTHDPQVKQL